jgi:DnaJ-class molecular chaperone
MSEQKQTPSTRTHYSDVETMNPGDEAPAGTPGTGEAVCPDCHGTGRRKDQDCSTCGGTGKVIAGIGGA